MLSAALVRTPRPAECARLTQLVAGERAAATAATADTSQSPELSAWSAAAATIMNLDEFLSRT